MSKIREQNMDSHFIFSIYLSRLIWGIYQNNVYLKKSNRLLLENYTFSKFLKLPKSYIAFGKLKLITI